MKGTLNTRVKNSVSLSVLCLSVSLSSSVGIPEWSQGVAGRRIRPLTDAARFPALPCVSVWGHNQSVKSSLQHVIALFCCSSRSLTVCLLYLYNQFVALVGRCFYSSDSHSIQGLYFDDLVVQSSRFSHVYSMIHNQHQLMCSNTLRVLNVNVYVSPAGWSISEDGGWTESTRSVWNRCVRIHFSIITASLHLSYNLANSKVNSIPANSINTITSTGEKKLWFYSSFLSVA